jgi:hypothetical protein
MGQHRQCGLVVGRARVPGALHDPFHRDRRVEEVVRLQRAAQVLVMLRGLGGGRGRETVLELNRHGVTHRFCSVANIPFCSAFPALDGPSVIRDG